MKIIYHCFGGSHSSVMSAAIHLGMLTKDKTPDMLQLLSLPYFDKTTNADFGSIRFMGCDKAGNEIYVLGKKSLANRYTRILEGVAAMLGYSDELIAVDTNCRVNWIMKIGGFLSRRWGWVRIGRVFLQIGSRQVYPALVKLVKATCLSIEKKKNLQVKKTTEKTKKILLVSRTGVHYSLIMAVMLLNQFSADNLHKITGFADMALDKEGWPIFAGISYENWEVYTLGAGRETQMTCQTITELGSLLGVSPQDLVIEPVIYKGEVLLDYIGRLPLKASWYKFLAGNIIRLSLFAMRFQVQTLKAKLGHITEG